MMTVLTVTAILLGMAGGSAEEVGGEGFRVGSAEREITPPPGLPMWGYGARHDKLAEGSLDPLKAKAIVIAAGPEKLAIVGLDLGRGPTDGDDGHRSVARWRKRPGSVTSWSSAATPTTARSSS